MHIASLRMRRLGSRSFSFLFCHHLKMSSGEVRFSNSSKTIALKQDNLFISAFPGYIVFGKVCPVGFCERKYFKFSFYQVFELYAALVSVIKFKVNENAFNDKGLILVIKDEVYFWSGSKVVNNGNENKTIKFGIEFKSEIIFELEFDSDDNFNNFINAVTKTLLPCLCLNQLEREVFEFVSDQSLSILITLNNLQTSKNLLKDFQEKNNLQIDSLTEPNIREHLIYYNEIIILYI